MTKELYGVSKLKYENQEEILEYYILKNQENARKYEVETRRNPIEIYGIEIVKRKGNQEERSYISDLTVNKELVQEITQKIMENTVTPIHLYDVLECFIS